MKKKKNHSNNEKTLEHFVKYCNEHPEMRFWQALVSWTKDTYDSDTEMLLVQVSRSRHLMDTFYWE